MLRKYYLILLVQFLLFVAQGGVFAKSSVREDRAYFPPVLRYHDIKPVPIDKSDVSVEDFQRELDWLKAEDYQTLSLEEMLYFLRKKLPFPKRAVVITFDGGYAGVYVFAAPELKKRNMRAAVFIIAGRLGQKAGTDHPYLTLSQVQELADSPYFSIQSLTLTHPHLTQLAAAELVKELSESRALTAGLTGKKCQMLAYPYGDYDEQVIQAAEQAGYDLAFASDDRGLYHKPARFSIPRIYMNPGLGIDELALFKEYIRTYKSMPAVAFSERKYGGK